MPTFVLLFATQAGKRNAGTLLHTCILLLLCFKHGIQCGLVVYREIINTGTVLAAVEDKQGD